MSRCARLPFRVVALAGLALVPCAARAQVFVLDPASPSLSAVPAASSDLLTPAGLPPAPPPPALAISAATLGLLPGDVIDAISYGDDGAVGGTLYFSVTRPSVGFFPGPMPPDAFTEVAAVPPGTQPESSGDLFASFDPACAAPGFNSQVLDGNGMALLVPSCYTGLGIGLAEGLALPGPPLNDDLSAFDWGPPGRYPMSCIAFSLAPGSPTLTAGTNPNLLGGGEPGDLLVSCPGAPFFMFHSAAALGLVSGGPGCAPPACDDVDALSVSFVGGGTVLFSLAPGSPSFGACPWSPADVLGGGVPPFAPCAPPFAPAALLALAAGDDVDALEVATNACSVAVAGDAPDFDGIGPL